MDWNYKVWDHAVLYVIYYYFFRENQFPNILVITFRYENFM